MTARTRALYPALAALALAGLSCAPSASADAGTPPSPVTPNTYFSGVVNPGRAFPGGVPAIYVLCPGPITAGETGHPASGQYVEAQRLLPPGASTVGFTGTAATQIDVVFSGATYVAANPPVVIDDFDLLVPVPTTLNLPCGGSGTASFVPMPTSPTANSATVQIDYTDIAA